MTMVMNEQLRSRNRKKVDCTVDCIEKDKAPKAPLAEKKKKRSTDDMQKKMSRERQSI